MVLANTTRLAAIMALVPTVAATDFTLTKNPDSKHATKRKPNINLTVTRGGRPAPRNPFILNDLHCPTEHGVSHTI